MAVPKPLADKSAMPALSGYFQMRQPRAADMQPSPPQVSGFSAPSATESQFRVTASNPPDVTKSATFSTDSVPRGSTGGSGFVGFEQYYGANAPTAQAEAQNVAKRAADYTALGQMQKGGVTPGEPTSPFDAMLMGRALPSAAAQEQGRRQEQDALRFKTLNERLGSARPDAAKIGQGAREAAYKQWSSDLPTQYRYNYTPAELRSMFEQEYAAGTWQQKTPGMVSTPGSSL